MNQSISIPWQQIQSAVWLIGLAIIAWQDWWWPGILVLVAISGITQGIVRQMAQDEDEEQPRANRPATAPPQATPQATPLPNRCPNCGGDISPDTVDRTSRGVDCPYCGTRLTAAAASAA